MSYKVTGSDIGPVCSFYTVLESAARTASKMEEEGVRDVKVFDPSGAEVLREEWEAAWEQWAERHPSLT